MLILRLKQCPEIIGGDSTRLRELLHPDRGYPFSGRYSLAQARLRPAQSSMKHRLKTDEVYYIVSGQGEMHVDNETAQVAPGDAVEIPPGAAQWLTNTGESDLVFLCIVDPPWKAEDEEIL